MSDWNVQIIEEFRANGGKVGGQFDGAPLLLLRTTGRTSGAERVNPVMYQDLGGDVAVFASKAGAPTDPDWYLNILANPEIEIEIGEETVPVVARVAEGDERDEIWERQKQLWPGFAEYEQATTRKIPVVVLSRGDS